MNTLTKPKTSLVLPEPSPIHTVPKTKTMQWEPEIAQKCKKREGAKGAEETVLCFITKC